MPVTTSLFDLTDKVALVSGGGTGIGKAIAAAFLQHGARVMIGGRRLDVIEQTVQELDALALADSDEPNVAGVTLDVTKTESVQRAVRKTVDVLGGVHIAVHAAGNFAKLPTFDLTTETMADLYDTHVTGALRLAQAAGHIFREQHDGCIINIASISSFMALTEVTAYASAKSALLGLTRNLATEWARFGIRTNAIAPGFIPTDINRKAIVGTDRGRRIIENTPMARFGTADEIAGAAVYLAAPAASFVNGQTITVDGGFLANGVGDATADWD
ncbi:SDR family NAD(P)-dependent oxidoreductase [Mucisphaera calidilacus]|uniref:2-dehydro-3-deoxy-D-gluconate 5-dehydrogenase n=1 Tax=Mucisphaera calidilacus TaxID=2527982 RepID=A0A518C056_9BACT|nr:SDR family oxidoreductase [Mucisphaera calidilacus]QDU72606.1 2-dehydro-3-deoxy-D-gluconate 5-dehydrogenase [Mucisphaera calidilacus]